MGVLKNELKANFTQIPNKMLLDNNWYDLGTHPEEEEE